MFWNHHIITGTIIIIKIKNVNRVAWSLGWNKFMRLHSFEIWNIKNDKLKK